MSLTDEVTRLQDEKRQTERAYAAERRAKTLEYQTTRERVHHVATTTTAAPKSRVEVLLDRETAGENIAPDEWKPLNPYAWNPRVAS